MLRLVSDTAALLSIQDNTPACLRLGIP